jgi:hypothetical protein
LESASVDVHDVAWQLSSLLSNISIPLNLSGSQNVLRATLEDMMDALETASSQQISPKAEWEEARASAAKATAAAAAKAACDADTIAVRAAASLAVALQPGSALLEVAKCAPVVPTALRRTLQSAGYLLRSVALQAGRAKNMVEDCQLFSAVAEHTEQLLASSPSLAVEPGSKRPTDEEATPKTMSAVTELEAALEEGVVTLALFSKPAVTANELSESYRPGIFAELNSRLRQCTLKLGCEASPVFDRAGFAQSARFDASISGRISAATPLCGSVVLPALRSGAQAEVVARLTAELEAKRRRTAVTVQQQAVLEQQNVLMGQQCKQMAALLEKHRVKMNSFMQDFPQRLDEAETHIAMDRRGLAALDGSAECLAPLHAKVEAFALSGALGPRLQGVLVTLLRGGNQSVVSFAHHDCPDGARYAGEWKRKTALKTSTSGAAAERNIADGTDGTDATDATGGSAAGRAAIDDVTTLLVPRMASSKLLTVLSRVARKTTACQYVVATGEMQCMLTASDAVSDRLKLAGGLFGIDDGVTAAVAPAPDGSPRLHSYLTDPATFATLSANDQRVFSAVLAGHTLPMLYVGAPLLVDGHVIGALCSVHHGLPEGCIELPGDQKAIQQAKADEISAFFSDLKT